MTHILNLLVEGINLKIICYNAMGRLDNVQWIKEEMQLADTLAKLGICNDKIKKNAISAY